MQWRKIGLSNYEFRQTDFLAKKILDINMAMCYNKDIKNMK